MYRCESWTIKKVQHQRTDVFKVRCWRRLFRVPWTVRRSNQSILKEINPEYSLKYWCWSSNTLEKTLMMRKTEDRRRERERMRWLDGKMASPTQWTWVWANSGFDGEGVLQFLGSQRVRHDLICLVSIWLLEQPEEPRRVDFSSSTLYKVHSKAWRGGGRINQNNGELWSYQSFKESSEVPWFQTGKGERQGCISSPCLFNLYAEYIMRNAGLDEAQLESRMTGEISITSDMQMTPPLWQKVKN